MPRLGIPASLALIAAMASAQSLSDVPSAAMPQIDGTVLALASAGGILYAGGSFSGVLRPASRLAAIDPASGTQLPGWPSADGTVSSLVPDDAGGFIAGGDFLSIGGVIRPRLARIFPGGAVDPAFGANILGTIRTLAVLGSTLYAGGTFFTVNGQPRVGTAAFDLTTGALLPWNPALEKTNGTLGTHVQVLAIAAAPGAVHLGGVFDRVQGQDLPRLVTVDPVSAQPTGWNPVPNGFIRSLLTASGRVWVGGSFTSIGGSARPNFAAFDAATGAILPMNPAPDAGILTMSEAAGRILLGGSFTNIGGALRRGLAAIDTASGSVDPWNPDLGGGGSPVLVRSLSVSSPVVCAGGVFATAGGVPRRNFAALDLASGAPNALAPAPDREVHAVAVRSGAVLIGGAFTTLAGPLRQNFLALDLATLGLLPAMDVDGPVRVLAAGGDRLYLGGDFSTVQGLSRPRLASVDVATGLLTAWNPTVTGAGVTTLVVDGGLATVSGNFTALNGQPRSGIGQIDALTGGVTPWNTSPSSGLVACLAAAHGVIYAGGSFTGIGGQARSRIAALDPVTALATPWNPGANQEVRSLLPASTTVYAGGFFWTLAGVPRSGLGEIDAVTGIATPWTWTSPLPPGTLGGGTEEMESLGPVLFTAPGSNFGYPPTRAYESDRLTGALRPWSAQTNQEVADLHRAGTRLFVGGGFATVNGFERRGLAAFDLLLPPASATDLGPACAGPPLGALAAIPPVLGGGYRLAITAPAGTPGMILAGGFLPASLPFGQGCLFQLDPATTVPLASFTVPGSWIWQLDGPLPPAAGAWGQTLRVQAILWPGAPIESVTNAVEVVFGY